MRALLHYTAGPRLRDLLGELSGDGLELGWSREGDRTALFEALRCVRLAAENCRCLLRGEEPLDRVC
jgi:hypothetical protein